MARLMENEEANGSNAYGLLEMMQDLRKGLFNELSKGQTIDRYRRNLQRAYVERLEFIMNNEQPRRRFFSGSSIDVEQSDIRPIVRAELKQLKSDARRASGRTKDQLSKIHLEDLVERIDMILDPK